MLRLVIVLLLALSSTALAAPEGFRESSRLTPRAQEISGNTSAVVYCANTYAAWAEKARELFGPATPAHRVRGITIFSRNAMYLSRPVCVALESWLRGKPASRWEVGTSALVLGHEAMHLRGVVEERAAECPALRSLPATLRRHFGVRKQATLNAMIAAAREENRRGPNAC